MGSVLESRAKRHFAAEALKQEFRQNRVRVEHAAPNPAEFVEIERQLKFFGEMLVPIARSHAAFLPVLPARIGFEFPQDLHVGYSLAVFRGSGTRGTYRRG